VPQQINPFRAGNPETSLFLVWRDGEAVFCEKDERGQFIARQAVHNIVPAKPLPTEEQTRLWMHRDYEQVLSQHAETEPDGEKADLEQRLQSASERYGEIMVRPNSDKPWFYLDQLGLYQDLN
jgi:CRISPR-associated endonuclease/helicase Cas3